MGLVGAGFVGPHHVDAVRRLGFVDIVAVAGTSDASGQQKARALGARRGYGSYRALIDDPDVQVVHNATPNHLHAEVTLAALAAGKHVVSDKPLARTLLNQHVMFRTGAGHVAALEDRCCHKSLPLSCGTVESSGVRCGYHDALLVVALW